MAVQPGPTFKRYAANGAATVYTIPFLLLDPANLQITLNGVSVTSGFTLAGLGNASSSCTFAVAPVGDLLFQQVMQFQRLTDYQMNGDFLSQTVNGDYDRLWLAIKQLNRDDGRALAVSPLEPEGIPALPVKALRTLKLLAFDAQGNPAPSNLTLEQLEQQPTLAMASAAEAQAFAGEASEYAELSGELASQSGGFAVAAEGAATLAASSASIASAISKPFPNTADGIAATSGSGAANRYFSVPIIGDSLAILYRNDAGAATEIGRAPSSAIVERLEAGNFDKVGLRMVRLSEESGYLWALVDSNNRAAFLIDLSGAVVIPKFLRLDVAEQRLAEIDGLGLKAGAGFKFVALPPESGYVWALVDENNRIALAVTVAGKVVGNFDLSAAVGGLITSQKDLYFLGDSLTNGAGGQITWRAALADLVSPRTHTNIAIGGQTSPQIVARAGAYVTLLTLAGNLIPASGPVAVTDRTIGLLTSQSSQSIKGRMSGVYGTLTRAGDDSYSFTRETAGAPVPVGKKLAFAPDIGTHGFDTWLIFIGANNIIRPDEIKRDIAAAVNAMKPVDKRFLVMTPVTGDSRYTAQCEEIEDWASQTYSDRVLKIREFSFQFNDGSAGDLADVAAGIIPRSLRIDGIHFTTFFHGKIAELVAAEINRRGW